jgi:hypothetical protein
MKLLFESLDAFLAEVRDRKVDIVRISPALAIDTGRRTAGIPHLVSRVLVTAALNDDHWAEWRHWVGRAIAEVGDRGLHVPAWLREKQDRALAEVSNRVDAAGLLIREGILTHDAGVIFHRKIGVLAAMAAGLLVGGPAGARPVPLDPLVRT